MFDAFLLSELATGSLRLTANNGDTTRACLAIADAGAAADAPSASNNSHLYCNIHSSPAVVVDLLRQPTTSTAEANSYKLTS